MAASVVDPGSVYGLVVSRGPVRAAKGIISQSLILATGDVTCGDRMDSSVVICEGDVKVGKHVSKCLIIARGNITIREYADRSTLIAQGSVTIAKPPEPVSAVPFADPERELRRREEWRERTVVEEKAVRPLGYITYFELSTVGVEVKAVDKVVAVAAVADGKAFAAAGVKAGDVITAVNGQKPESAEALRRLLRDALAVGDATVTLKRGDKTVTVKLALPE
jgi:membrane-associated protease RseP (regulator of RpoE activity)